MGRNGPPTITPSGNTYSASLFMIAACGAAAAWALCRATDARELKWVAIPAITISGIATTAISNREGRLPPSIVNAWSDSIGWVIHDEIGALKIRALRNDWTSSGLKA